MSRILTLAITDASSGVASASAPATFARLDSTVVPGRRPYVVRFEGGPLGTRENKATRRIWQHHVQTQEPIRLETPDGLTATYERVGAPMDRVVTFRYVGP